MLTSWVNRVEALKAVGIKLKNKVAEILQDETKEEVQERYQRETKQMDYIITRTTLLLSI